MKPEAQRIAIAQACGWNVNPLWPVTPTHAVYKRGDEHRVINELPDYLSDLNAMHDAEKVLSDERLEIYFQRIGPRSTAAQRAEAFLKAIGKWES